MFEPNAQKLLAELKPSDVGGWACPFNRANWIMDAEPYETRGFYRVFGSAPSQGGEKEWFGPATWVRRDICSREPFPFADKSIDFAICSHTLEDIRDPLWVCSELMRVAKRGYIEVPSREWETCRGVERPNLAGLSHHRWLIEIAGNHVRFQMKYHMLHSHWSFSFPAAHARRLRPEQAVQWLWWDKTFECTETIINGLAEQERELTQFVQRVRPYPAWRITLDRRARGVRSLANRAIGKCIRLINGR